jgi:hypothetical protein
MKVFTKTKLMTAAVFLCSFGINAQLKVTASGSFYTKANTIVYSNENTSNDGVFSFEKDSEFIVDKDFENNANSVLSLPPLDAPAFFMSRSTLRVGSGSSRSNVAQTLSFRTAGTAYPSTSVENVANADQILFVKVNKTGGAVTVDRGMLHLTSTNVADDGQSTLQMITATTLNANNRVTMLNTAVDNVALVAESHNSAVVNDIIVEKLIPAKRGTRFLNATTSGSTINAAWQEGVHNTAFTPWPASNNNPRPGFGTHITGNGGTGTDPQPSGNSSLFAFDNVTRAWSPVHNTTGTVLNTTTPYRIVIRGDRSVNINLNASPATQTILRTKGSLYFGDRIHAENNAAVNGKLVFFTNPYQSIVDINALTSTNTTLSTAGFQGYDPTRNTNGAWVTVNNLGSGNGAASVAGSAMNKFLQPGQSFFVGASTANPTLTFAENKRIVSNNLTTIFDEGTSKTLKYNLYKQQDLPNLSTAIAGGVVDFGSYSNNTDEYDSVGSNNIDETIYSVTNDNQNCLWQRRELPNDNEILPLNISRYRQQNYALRLEIVEFLGKDAFLKDNFLNVETPIEVGTNLMYNFTVDSSIAGSVATNRFDIIFKNSLSTNQNNVNNITLYPNPISSNVFYISTNNIAGQKVTVKIVNMLGQLINSIDQEVPTDGILEIKSAYLAEGVYNIILENENKQIFNSKLIKNN